MKKGRLVGLLCVLCCTFASALFNPVPAAQAQSRQTINGTVVGIGGRFAGRTRPFTLIVNSYTSPGQVRELNDALRDGGQDGLLRALSGMNAGRIQVGTGVGLPVSAIIADPWNEGGTRLTVFYERNVSFYELRYGARSENYRVGYAEIFLDRNGRGQGTFIPAARVRLRDGNTWEVEDFGVFPARLMGLRASGNVLVR
ncbi:MAG TPA: hypothetical protein VGB73_11635 [Pyrinomonadaceae bacterium]|jgi:hypothetical protein